MDSFRPFVEGDLPAVAALFNRVFRKQSGQAPPSLQSYLAEIYLNNPWREEVSSSIVYESEGHVAGFVGGYPFPFILRGLRIQAVIAGNFMVDPTHRKSLAAVRLLKHFLSGPQDATITDTSSDAAKGIWEGLGAQTIQTYSLQWLRVLRPAQSAIALMSRGSTTLSPLSVIAKPFCFPIDALARAIRQSPFSVGRSDLEAEELRLPELLEGIRGFSAGLSLIPDYSISTLKWLIRKAAEKKEFGTLHMSALYDKNHNLAGWYLYYPNPGNLGQVLQCIAKPMATRQVLQHLFYDAMNRGSLALVGRFDPRMARELSLQNCLFVHRGTSVQVHSKNPGVSQALHSGDAFFTRLEGEWWTRFQGDRFD